MLLDTSGLLYCLDADEARHSKAIEYFNTANRRLTRNYVLAEFVAITQARRLPRSASLAFAAAVAHDPAIEIFWVDPTMHQGAMEFLQTQLDKSYSLCDAVSFLLMQHNQVHDALTTDRHFERAGFNRLLPS